METAGVIPAPQELIRIVHAALEEGDMFEAEIVFDDFVDSVDEDAHHPLLDELDDNEVLNLDILARTSSNTNTIEYLRQVLDDRKLESEYC